MIFDLLAPPQGPRGWGSKKLCRCMCHWCKLLTHQIWLNFGSIFFGPLNPPPPPHTHTHGTPKSDPWGMSRATNWKSRLICFISFICEKTHKVWFRHLWHWLCNWNLMIFNYIYLLAHSPGDRAKKCVVAHPINVSNSHTKFGWISSNGLGGDVTDRWTDGRGDCNIPDSFLKKRGDNNIKLSWNTGDYDHEMPLSQIIDCEEEIPEQRHTHEYNERDMITQIERTRITIPQNQGQTQHPKGAQWLSGRELDSRLRGRGFESHRCHCVVVLEQDTFILA